MRVCDKDHGQVELQGLPDYPAPKLNNGNTCQPFSSLARLPYPYIPSFDEVERALYGPGLLGSLLSSVPAVARNVRRMNNIKPEVPKSSTTHFMRPKRVPRHGGSFTV